MDRGGKFDTAQLYLNRFALSLCELTLVMFAIWGLGILAAEVGRADSTYAFLYYLFYVVGLAILCFAVSLWVRLWATSTPPGFFPFVVMAAVPLVIAYAMVLLRPGHAYTQQPIKTLLEVIGR